MVQITIPSALLQTYTSKCNHIYDVNVKALTKICGLNNSENSINYYKLKYIILNSVSFY